MSLLERGPGRRAHFSRLDWWRWRLSARLGLLLYAAGRAVQRWHLRLRAGLPSRPARVRPVTAPEGPARPSAGQGTAPATPPAPAGAVPPITRDGLPVIRAGGVLLPGRMRETPHVVIDGPVVPRWFTEWEQGRWMP